MYTLLLKKKSNRKHWYQSHSHTHSNNRDMGCGVRAIEFITCVQMATRVPSWINYSWLVRAIGRHEHEQYFVSEKACCTSNQVSTRPSLHTATCRCFPPGYAVVGFTFYLGCKSEGTKPAVNITHMCDGDKTKINMKHSDADHTDIGFTKSPLV
jgi:hypothetical protein